MLPPVDDVGIRATVVSQPAIGTRNEEGAVRIGTWNVEYAAGQDKNRRRRAILVRHDCDVWVLTETHDDLRPSDAHKAVHSEQRPTGRPGGRWASIWTRYPVLQRIEVVDPKRTVAALIEAPSGPVIVFGTVMPWANDRGDAEPGATVRGWSELHRVVVQQGKEWVNLRRRFPEADLCVAGDLNMNLGGKHYYGTARSRLLLREAMADCSLYCATETDRFPAGTLSHPPIDHVLLPATWEAHASVVGAWEGREESGRRLSDHSGLAVAVTLTTSPFSRRPSDPIGTR